MTYEPKYNFPAADFATVFALAVEVAVLHQENMRIRKEKCRKSAD